MKKCPKCQRFYDDASLNFCLEDGVGLIVVEDAPEPTLRFVPAPTVNLPIPATEQSIDVSPILTQTNNFSPTGASF